MGKTRINKKNIGITGSDGFIGKHLVKYLKNDGSYNIKCFNGDLLKESDVKEFFRKKDFDTVIHLAGTFFGDFAALMDANFKTTENLLRIGKENGLKKIIFSSSGAVYGEPIKGVSKESDPTKPNTYYGVTKLYAEKLIELYNYLHGLQYVILRFPNVYGEGNDKGVIYNFLDGIENKGKITVYGDGSASRNFLHVSDACNAIYRSINYKNSDIFNISNPQKISINDLVSELKKDRNFKVIHKEANNKLHDLLLDIGKAREKLKFEPKVKDTLI